MDKDFEVFYQEDLEDSRALTRLHLVVAQVSTSQEALNVTEAMVLEEKTFDLLALLTAHVGGDSPVVPIVPHPSTPALAQIATSEATKKKRKRGKATEGAEEGEISQPAQQPPTKEPRTTRAHQKKGTAFGTNKGTEGEQRPKSTIWNPAFVLSSRDLVTTEASLRDS